MDVIASGRKTSRTTRLIERAAELEKMGQVCYIVCHTREEAYRIAQKAEELKLQIGFPLTFVEFLEGGYEGRNVKHFLIDNADYLLQSLTPIHIDTIVVHKESPEL